MKIFARILEQMGQGEIAKLSTVPAKFNTLKVV